MALTFTIQNTVLNGNRRETYGTVTFDASYPTGGEAFTARDAGLDNLEQFTAAAAGYQLTWNRSASAPKLLAYYGDNNNASDGPLIDVPNTTDLSTVVGTFRAVGW
jgi:hypothetical protein